jgi:hypothetical protein
MTIITQYWHRGKPQLFDRPVGGDRGNNRIQI